MQQQQQHCQGSKDTDHVGATFQNKVYISSAAYCAGYTATAASPSAQAAKALTVLGSSFGTKGSLAFLTHLSTDTASQSLDDDVLDSVLTTQQVTTLPLLMCWTVC